MTSKKKSTLHIIIEACDQLSSNGIRPTYETIRAVVGGNNPVATKQALVIWYAKVFETYHIATQLMANIKEELEITQQKELEYKELISKWELLFVNAKKINEELQLALDVQRHKVAELISEVNAHKGLLEKEQDFWIRKLTDETNKLEINHAKQIAALESKLRNADLENKLLTAKLQIVKQQ